MRFLASVAIFLAVTVTSSCQDRRNVKVTGKVVDDLTGDPISNAEVVVLCWYKHNIDDDSYTKETVMTDSNGSFVARFDKGHKVAIASQAFGFVPIKKQGNKVVSSEINFELRLKKENKNKTAISHLTTGADFGVLTEQTPFLRLRTQNNRTVTYGFDFVTLTTKTDTMSCDLWFKVEARPMLLVVHGNGGVIPILRNEVNSSLLYEMDQAPTAGYLKSHRLTGNEEGFFIKCRDGKTYAKILLTKGVMEITGADNAGSFKDRGRYFSYIYQPNGSVYLELPNAKLDLERFLIDFSLD